jgi:hypothetical protein
MAVTGLLMAVWFTVLCRMRFVVRTVRWVPFFASGENIMFGWAMLLSVLYELAYAFGNYEFSRALPGDDEGVFVQPEVLPLQFDGFPGFKAASIEKREKKGIARAVGGTEDLCDFIGREDVG